MSDPTEIRKQQKGRMNLIETHIKPLREQKNLPDATRTTWEHIVIENGYGEQRFLCRGIWAGDTYFYVDRSGLTYERYPSTDGETETFEQLSSGDRWTMCNGYYLNSISGELADKVNHA